MPTRVLFVCLGNICRSPTAEAVFQKLVDDRGLGREFEIDSAGTGGWHVGDKADSRMRKAAKRRGFSLQSRARQVEHRDFDRFDRIIAMDRENLAALRGLASIEHHDKIALFRQLDPEPSSPDVPDPYYGGPSGFDEVLDIVERCSRAWLAHLTEPE